VKADSRWTLPNIITVVRIVAAPAVLVLALAPSVSARAFAFLLFVAAALSDVWDGYLARKHGWITDMGKLLDPLADKLLLVATFIPFFLISRRPGGLEEVPWWGPLPVWVVVVIFGRELGITLFRSWASRRGVVIAAGKSGKQKALFQNLFSGALLLWYPVQQHAMAQGWSGGSWQAWAAFHRALVALTLAVAVLLTVYSAVDYLWRHRAMVRDPGAHTRAGA